MSTAPISHSYELIPATISDCETIAALMSEYYTYDHLRFDPDVARNALQNLMAKKEYGTVWTVRVAAETVGYLICTFGYSLEFGGRYALIDELYISEMHRGQGIGSGVLRFIEVYCRSLGITVIRLEVERSNARAVAVYRKNGFKAHDRDIMTREGGDG